MGLIGVILGAHDSGVHSDLSQVGDFREDAIEHSVLGDLVLANIFEMLVTQSSSVIISRRSFPMIVVGFQTPPSTLGGIQRPVINKSGRLAGQNGSLSGFGSRQDHVHGGSHLGFRQGLSGIIEVGNILQSFSDQPGRRLVSHSNSEQVTGKGVVLVSGINGDTETIESHTSKDTGVTQETGTLVQGLSVLGVGDVHGDGSQGISETEIHISSVDNTFSGISNSGGATGIERVQQVEDQQVGFSEDGLGELSLDGLDCTHDFLSVFTEVFQSPRIDPFTD
mmetsp:Transcript_46500/g.53609  ORF Transcript_46500/g.53609 Transcript_46500/m.53609 type:complete len:280 (+) Transcript_46500:283-1122(+)